jgi:hypothetical protein
MHTTAITDPEDPDKSWVFNHNGDYSGDVLISANDGTAILDISNPDWPKEVVIPYAVLEMLVAHRIMNYRISTLENMDWDECAEALRRGEL